MTNRNTIYYIQLFIIFLLNGHFEQNFIYKLNLSTKLYSTINSSTSTSLLLQICAVYMQVLTMIQS